MASKLWLNLSVLLLASAVLVGCNTPQKNPTPPAPKPGDPTFQPNNAKYPTVPPNISQTSGQGPQFGPGFQQSGSSFQQTPGSSFQQTPGSSFQQTPGSSFQQTPGSSFQQTPGSSFQQTPGSGLQQPPVPGFQSPGLQQQGTISGAGGVPMPPPNLQPMSSNYMGGAGGVNPIRPPDTFAPSMPNQSKFGSDSRISQPQDSLPNNGLIIPTPPGFKN